MNCCCCPAVSVLSCSLSAVLRWVGWVGTFQGHHSYIARLWHHFPGYYYGTADSAVGENVNGTYGWEQSRHGSACSRLAFSWVDPLRNFHSSECHLPRTHTHTYSHTRTSSGTDSTGEGCGMSHLLTPIATQKRHYSPVLQSPGSLLCCFQLSGTGFYSRRRRFGDILQAKIRK